MSEETKVNIKVKGEWWDEVYEHLPDGTKRLVHTTEKRTNTKMDDVALVIAGLMAGDPAVGGIVQHAIGRGDPGWGAVPPAVNTADSVLFDEIVRNAPDSIVYLDGADLPTASRTNVIRVRTIFGPADAAGETIREQALFGGGATAVINTGDIINTIRHEGFVKSGAVSIARNIKLTYS